MNGNAEQLPCGGFLAVLLYFQLGMCDKAGKVSAGSCMLVSTAYVTVLLCAEYEDLNGGCPTPANSSVRPAYIYPVDNTISDPWAYYKRTLTFQVNTPHWLWALHVAVLLCSSCDSACCDACLLAGICHMHLLYMFACFSVHLLKLC